MSQHPRDLCPQKFDAPLFNSRPARTAIHPAAVYHCHSAEHASQVLANETPGYAYQRDGHPNADVLAAKCQALHAADVAVVTSSGQSALVAAVMAQLKPGDHVLLSNRLYGGTSVLVGEEAQRWKIESTEVDTCDLEQTIAAFQANTKMVVVETISNPTLRIPDIKALAELSRDRGAALLVDNTFATPIVCKPLELGADLVMESMTKFMNGHGDVIMGMLCGNQQAMERVPKVVSQWGLAASPFDCWLTERGLETLYVRMMAAAETCFELSQKLLAIPGNIERIDFPGLPSHKEHQLATSQFANHRAGKPLFANMMTLHLSGGLPSANLFMERCRAIPYCPSLGETVTTLSHPASSSHRNLDESQLNQLGMSSGSIRLSIGLESPEYLFDAISSATAD